MYEYIFIHLYHLLTGAPSLERKRRDETVFHLTSFPVNQLRANT